MGQEVSANGRSILHKGHGMTHTCAPPDVCKTPSPGGPVPIPYVNVGMDSNITGGAESVTIEGNPVANTEARIATTSGDEPGTVGGLISSKFKGTVTWKTGSLDVKAEGKSVVRFLDTGLHNGNTFNVAFINAGQTAVAYADDFVGPCPICKKGPREHRVHESTNSAALCRQIIDKLHQDPANFPRKRKNGYMVGVMICKCGKKWAAMSGNTLPGFETAAGGIVDEVVTGGVANVGEYVAANNTLDRDLVEQVIGNRWSAIEQLRAGTDADAKRGYNIPGMCAGAKLMARSNGHAAKEMTEMFAAPPAGNWNATYRWLTREESDVKLKDRFWPWRRRVLQNKASRLEETPFTTDESVASCHTCQKLLPLTNCPKKTCP
jgi:hypothetical protein